MMSIHPKILPHGTLLSVIPVLYQNSIADHWWCFSKKIQRRR